MGRFLRYAASSAAATLASAATFAIAHRLLHLGWLASILASLAGFVINFTGNRYWTWARRRQRGLGRDVLGYLALTVLTALAAALVTDLADGYTNRLGISGNQQTALAELAYFATYGAMFLVKFVVLDRVLFPATDQSR